MTASGLAAQPARPIRNRLLPAAVSVFAAAIALGCGALLILASGENPWEIYGLMIHESLGTGYGIGQTLFKATPLMFTGLAVALGFRAGLFNIGAEGQLYLGGFAAGLAGIALPGAPGIVALPLTLAAAAGAGALWGAIPGALKARFGAHEVIITIMLNFISFGLVAYVGSSVFQPATVRTAEVGAGVILPRFDTWIPALRGAPVNMSLVLAVAAAFALFVFLQRTRRGYELRAVGLNPHAAEYAGISVGATQILAMALSGGLAGLGGVNYVLGYKHYFELGFSGGAGFLGIAIALLGRNHPVGVVLAALFFGALSYGGLVIHQRVPKELVDTLQGIIIVLAVCAQPLVQRSLRSR